MLIGIDASRAVTTRRTGTENYSIHLIREILALRSPNRFRLYFREEPPPALWSGMTEAAEFKLIPFPRLWTHLRLSWEMYSSPPDLLFVPSHVLPLVHPHRCVATVHDLGFHYYPQAHTLSQNLYLRWSTRHNAQVAMAVLADSQATRSDLARFYHVAAERISVVYPGIDENMTSETDASVLAAVRERYGIMGPYLLYVGTLHPRKNLVRLVQAYGSLARELSEPPQLVLAGQKGWMYDEVLAEIRRLGLLESVLITGYVPDADLSALYTEALAFIFPSLYEGFGFPILEAMACGTPVVCSSTSSLPEVAGEAALQVNPLDVESIAGGLNRIVSDEGLRRDLVQRGLKQVRLFSWRRCAQETLSILEEVGA